MLPTMTCRESMPAWYPRCAVTQRVHHGGRSVKSLTTTSFVRTERSAPSSAFRPSGRLMATSSSPRMAFAPGWMRSLRLHATMSVAPTIRGTLSGRMVTAQPSKRFSERRRRSKFGRSAPDPGRTCGRSAIANVYAMRELRPARS